MKQYGPLLEKLLQGDFICEVSASEYYRQLSNDTVREQINQYLEPLNRRLASNSEDSVWFLSYLTIDSDIRDTLSGQLKETVDSLIPLLQLLQLIQETTGSDRILSAHDVINRHSLAASIENNTSLREQLQQLVKTRLFYSQSDDVGGQLKLIFDRLSQQSYVFQPHKERHIYYVTGKIEYLIEVARFIQQEEQIEIEEAQTQQQELLS